MVNRIFLFLAFLTTLSVVFCADYKFLNLEKCSSSNDSVFEITKCELSQSTATMKADIKTELIKFYVRIVLDQLIIKNFLNFIFHQILVQFYTKQDGNFRQIFKVPRIEWCRLMAGSKNTNFILRSVIDAFKEKYPTAFHKCPYTGLHEVNNVTIPKKLFTIFPSGLFIMNITITDDTSKAFFIGTVLMDIIS
jgi:hypothetical protein